MLIPRHWKWLWRRTSHRALRDKENRMTRIRSFAEYNARLRGFITTSEPDQAGFNQLALALFALQFAHVEPYRRLCMARRVSPDKVTRWTEIPSVPSAAFKEFELTSLPVEERAAVFHSSGTSAQRPSRHFHSLESLAVYESSLLPWFKAHLLPETEKFGFLILTPSPISAPCSSLAHMFETVRRAFGSSDSHFSGQTDSTGAWVLDWDTTFDALRKFIGWERPLALLGTAFSFVHLLDALATRNLIFTVPAGSRAMETGGYKGRSRTMPQAELRALITRHLGIPASHIVGEYGMSELSSQAYDCTAGSPERGTRNETRTFQFPPWARVRMVCPETGREVAEGETGWIQVYDLANIRSVLAVQTEDLGIRRGQGFEWIGRGALAEPRGCSLMHL